MEWEYLDKDRLLFRASDGNIYETLYSLEDTDEIWKIAVLKEIGSDRKVLRLPPDDPAAQFHLWVNGIDLYEVNENVREIVLENRSGFIGSNPTLPDNFIRDPKKLPNLREIRAITRDHSGKCLTNVWIKGWDKRNVPYLIRLDGMVYAIKDSNRGTVRTRLGCASEGGCNVEGDLVLPDKVFDGEKEYTLKEIAYYSFRENNIRSVSIPPSVKIIEPGAFRFCHNLERVLLSEGLEKIEEHAFSGCLKLKEIVFPDSLVYIGEQDIPPLKHVRIPASLRYAYLESETITIQSKYDPAILDELILFNPKEIFVEDDCDTLRAVNGVLYDKDIKELLCYPPLKEDKVFTVPASVKSISENAFSCNIRHLRELRIPSSVRKIPSSLKCIRDLRVTRIKKKPGKQEES